MCGLVGSFDFNKVEDLYNVNKASGRGTVAWSLSAVEVSTGYVTFLASDRNTDFNSDGIFWPYRHHANFYYILHSLAPTSGEVNIHPAILHNEFQDYDEMLWHNGIIKAKEVERLKKFHPTVQSNWDTYLLLCELKSVKTLNNIDGTFACFYSDGKSLSFFRNELAQLYIDCNMNICTEPFIGSDVRKVDPNTFFRLQRDIYHENRELGEDGYFKTFSNPYFF